MHQPLELQEPPGADPLLPKAGQFPLLPGDAALLPYCLSAGTDNKALEALGIHGYGFVPLKLPADLNFAMLFHGVDERVPVDAVRFGARVLRRLLDDC